jgi:hypothetical protein
MAFVQVTLKHSDVESYAWMAAIAAPWLVAVSVVGKRVKCARCQKNLFRELAYGIGTPLTLLRDGSREHQTRRNSNRESEMGQIPWYFPIPAYRELRGQPSMDA